MRALLQAEPGLAVVGEVAEGQLVVDAVERLKPNVLVLDLMLPGVGGLDVTRLVARRFPGTRIVVLSMYAMEAYVREALHNGASGYVIKDAGSAELIRAIREVAAGRRYLSPPLSEGAIEAYASSAGDSASGYESLTTREREVLRLSAEGRSGAVIAERLGISPRTAETHRHNLMQKLGLHSRTELVRFALKHGLLPPE